MKVPTIRAGVPTPALLLDIAALDRNIATMASWAQAHGVAVRPHAKTHKCVEIARRQLAAGAIGLTVATVYEAEAMLDADPPEILIANEVVGAGHIARLVAVAERTPTIVAVDDIANAQALSTAARTAGVEVGVLVDLDVGLHRCGARSVDEAVAIAGAVAELPGLRLRGAMGFEGQAMTEPDRERRSALVGEAMGIVSDAVEALRAAGHQVEIVAAGGTNTHDMTGAIEVVTELQVGTYAVIDTAYLPLAQRFEAALSVATMVVSRHGDRVVTDCGSKAVAIDVAWPGVPSTVGTVREVHEEHTLIDVVAGSDLQIGDRLELSVGYAGGTVNLHEAYLVVEGEEVVDVWRIRARGPGYVASPAGEGSSGVGT